MPEYGVYTNDGEKLVNTNNIGGYIEIDRRLITVDYERNGFRYGGNDKSEIPRRKATWELNLANYATYSNKNIRIFSKIYKIRHYDGALKRLFTANNKGILEGLPVTSFELTGIAPLGGSECVFNDWSSAIPVCTYAPAIRNINANTKVNFDLVVASHAPNRSGSWSDLEICTYIEEIL